MSMFSDKTVWKRGGVGVDTKDRVLYADVLRLMATFAVIMLHVAAVNFSGSDVHSSGWIALNLYDSLVRWCVPVFFMLSGMFFLDPARKLSYSKLYGKNLLRLATAYLFWSAATAFVAYKTVSWDMVKTTWKGPLHFWFLFALAGLYIVTPVLRLFIAGAKQRDLQYFLLLCAIFAVFIPALPNVPVITVLKERVAELNIHLVMGYVGFFVGGYYLKTYSLSKRARVVLYALGLLGLAATFGLTLMASWQKGAGVQTYYGYFMPNVVLTACALFVFVRERLRARPPGARTVRFVLLGSRLSFGIYLMHLLSLDLLRRLGLTNASFSPFLSVPVIAILAFSICFLISWGLSKLPVFNKYGM